MSIEQSDIWMAGDEPQTPSSPRSIQSESDDDHGASEKQSRPKDPNLPPIPSVGPKVPLDKVYLMGTQAAIFYEDLSRTQLPPEVNCLDEATRIALAVQLEERNCLQVKIDLAARRCRYHAFSSHHHQLKVERFKKEFEKISQQVSAAIADAVNKHKASQPHSSTNVQNPNTSGGPVRTQGVPGQPAATTFQSKMQYRPSSAFPSIPAHMQASQAANGPHMSQPGPSGQVQPNTAYRFGLPPYLNPTNLQAPQPAGSPHMTRPGASGHVQSNMPRGPFSSAVMQGLQYASGLHLPNPRDSSLPLPDMSLEMGRYLPKSVMPQAAQVVSSPQSPHAGATGHVQGPPNIQAPQPASGTLSAANAANGFPVRTPGPEIPASVVDVSGKNEASQPANGNHLPHCVANVGSAQTPQAISPSAVETSRKNVASQPADGMPPHHTSAGGTGSVRTPSQATIADTAGMNVASQPSNGIPPPHTSASDVPVWAPPQAPSVIDTPAKNEASQPTGGKPSPHHVTDSRPVQASAQVTPPSVVDASSRNEVSQPVEGTHLPHVGGNGKRPRSDSSTSNPFVHRRRLQQE